jgi:DNA (cytosine-5)-methyltransferase 1
MTDLTVVDLFCGAGGFALGFHRAGGYSCVLALDHDVDSTETFSLNFPSARVITADVRNVDFADTRADVIVAGPPCQGFSTLNRSRANDARNALVFEVLRACDQAGARAVVVENVPPFLDAPEGRRLLTQLRQRGFGTRSGVVNAADYGVAQRRLRALVVGLRGRAAVWPRPSHSDDPASGLPRHRTVADALALLPPNPDGRGWHRPYDLTNAAMAERYRAVPEGGSRRDLPSDLTLDCWVDTRGYGDVLGRLHWRRPATTVRTEFHRPEKGRFLHPTEHRPLTPREAARLQSFPDSFAFPETQTLTSVARQIGNAIPPRLAQAIARELATALMTRDARLASMPR